MRRVWTPALLLLVVAPFCGEALSTATGPLTLVRPDRLPLMVALYGCGALVCREVALRCRLGLAGLLLLGAAYGVWEEALVDRYWFSPEFWDSTGVGSYSVVGQTNVLLAAHLTLFHAAVSVGCSVLLVEWLTPRCRDRPWVNLPVLGVAAAALASTPLLFGELDAPAPVAGLVAGGVAMVGLAALAWVVGRQTRGAQARGADSGLDQPWRPGLSLLAFGVVLVHWVVTYGIATSGVPWPVGVALALAPVLLGALAIRRLAAPGPWVGAARSVVAGLLAFFALLDLFVAVVAARLDLLLAAALAAAAVVWFARGRRPREGRVRAVDRATPP